jgi:hypothetical protein
MSTSSNVTSRTMTMPVRDDLDLACIARRRMLALERAEQALLEEAVRALCCATLFELLSDVQWLARSWVGIRLEISLRPTQTSVTFWH